MEVIFLGTGTSVGVPVIGCSCPVCISSDPKNRRLRPSVLIRRHGKNILIDTATDFRTQALLFGVRRVDAILFTHWHADHVFGLDDIRIFNAYQRETIPCFGNKETMKHVRSIFSYAFEKTQEGGGKPRIELNAVREEFEVLGQVVEPVEVCHGRLRILGYRLDRLAYITDCNKIPENSIERLRALDVLILGALRYAPHPTHYSLEEALQIADLLLPKKVYLTHLSHAFDHDKTNRELPSHVHLAYDGLRFEL